MPYRSNFNRPYPRRRSSPFGALGAILMVVIVAIVLVVGCAGYADTSNVRLRVNDKESVAKSGGDHEYRVYTDQGTFKVTDSIVHPRFNSSDVYGALREGQTYDCEVYGYRIPLFSQFKNILRCTQA